MKTTTILVRVSEEEKAALVRLATESGVTLSDLVRSLVAKPVAEPPSVQVSVPFVDSKQIDGLPLRFPKCPGGPRSKCNRLLVACCEQCRKVAK